MIDYSIEYCHIYTNQKFSQEHNNSCKIFKKIQEDLKGHSIQGVVMIDDYSPEEVAHFDYRALNGELEHLKVIPEVFIRESQLIDTNYKVLDLLKDSKIKRNISNYIATKGKHPCSLFVASWYLIRLGIIANSFNIKGAVKLVNILPAYFITAENKARDIIQSVAGENAVSSIENIYIGEVSKTLKVCHDKWEHFNPESYVVKNFFNIYAQDVFLLTALVKYYRDNKFKNCLEVGSGSNLFPILTALPYCEKLDVIELGTKNINYLKKQQKRLDVMWVKYIELIKIISGGLEGYNFAKAFQEKVNIIQGDIYNLPAGKYDSASMHNVAESITDNEDDFYRACTSFKNSVQSGGSFIASFMENSEGYTVNGVAFPAVKVKTYNVERALGTLGGFISGRLGANIDPVREGYTGIIYAKGKII